MKEKATVATAVKAGRCSVDRIVRLFCCETTVWIFLALWIVMQILLLLQSK
jgi:hypothetical protein